MSRRGLRGRVGIERAVGAQHDLVIADGGVTRHIPELDVANDAFRLARGRLAEAAAARRLQPHFLAGTILTSVIFDTSGGVASPRSVS